MIVVVSSESFVSFENGEIFKMVWIIYGPAKLWGKNDIAHTERIEEEKKMYEKTSKKSDEHTLMRKSRVLRDKWTSIISAPIHCYKNWLNVIWNAKLNKRPLNAHIFISNAVKEIWVKLYAKLTSYCSSVVFWFVTDVGSISKAGVPSVDSTFVAEIQFSNPMIKIQRHLNALCEDAYLQQLYFA